MTRIDSTRRISPPPPIAAETNLSPAQWGMISFLVSEVAFFSTLIVAYLTFLGQDKVGPTPSRGAVAAAGLVHDALPAVEQRDDPPGGEEAASGRPGAASASGGRPRSCSGVVFLLGTAYEWRELITRHHLTISRNLFGTTYYTLVGFHGLHVTAGVVVMLIVLGLALGRQVTARNRVGVEMVSWYWHFVDGVWVVVFTVVYLVGR